VGLDRANVGGELVLRLDPPFAKSEASPVYVENYKASFRARPATSPSFCNFIFFKNTRDLNTSSGLKTKEV